VPDRVAMLLVDEDPSGECIRPVPMAFIKGTEPQVSCSGFGQRRAETPPTAGPGPSSPQPLPPRPKSDNSP